MNTFKTVLSLILTGLICGLIYYIVDLSGCNPFEISETDTIIKIDTVKRVDTVKRIDTVFVKPAETIIYVEIPQNIDSLEIAKQFFAQVFREDTLVNDSNLFFRLQQLITQNDVKEQIIDYEIYQKEKIITETKTITVDDPDPKHYIGAFAFTNFEKVAPGVKFMIRTEKDAFYSVGAGYQVFYVDASVPLRVFSRQSSVFRKIKSK